jgi:methylated-DNA-[protein]-cysteine S-methyltransferase
MVKLFLDEVNSEIGTILIASDGEKLCALDFADCRARMVKLLQKRFKFIDFIKVVNPQGFSQCIQAYLEGNFYSLDQVPVSIHSTPFQQQVWLTLRTIPPGTVISYKELALGVGKPNAYRAVGMANSHNPIAIVLPCHRVVGTNAKLTGYAGGLKRKRWLLQHEGVNVSKLE